MDNLEKTFQKRLKKLGIAKQVEAAMVCEEAQKFINDLFGKDVSQEAAVISFDRGVLKIKTSGSLWAQEIFLQAEKIKDKLPSIKNVRTIL
ncbi:MAG: hypothetical protein UU65_C0002G0199 [candidate division CPR2 bacterium GW2011_GWC1_41_48]|uniref:DUF721 domain-containing protein n=1 Tax=candidate division CPR2 bacterium GW2011_GWC1_41_48 TaxID=1618344 RepID=A0A0G0YIN7_UNCC2|nr:MAG: hypothetical protein UT47_C0002G0105 [candidate division CPR2 bacterium GW2011_GWC2_39_35]KKR27960.1 MAG: hypothetical protein UT60_C0031G0011 [candidate division CPR2 bacterium GW2011_GWD2_39_7]KKS09421.1 MAG: hypothetical protein UU65_C0002G0199 [candidate division CPR2 bacterium GW2011_GWC1_41_48]OGB72071.1 MAG: hypothetical protein A2Y26_01915 [candidate division CPR2 bacterium GWD2_39_7]